MALITFWDLYLDLCISHSFFLLKIWIYHDFNFGTILTILVSDVHIRSSLSFLDYKFFY